MRPRGRCLLPRTGKGFSWIIATALLTGVFPGALHARQKSLPSCVAWLTQTAKGADKRNRKQWRDWTISTLPESCSAIPENLREAAAQVQGVKNAVRRAQILATAAMVALGTTCPIPEPLADARKLATTCRLPPNIRFRLDESILSDIRAVDYGLLNTMLKALIGANEYAEPAERVMLNFTLSAQILGENVRLREQRKARHVREDSMALSIAIVANTPALDPVPSKSPRSHFATRLAAV